MVPTLILLQITCATSLAKLEKVFVLNLPLELLATTQKTFDGDPESSHPCTVGRYELRNPECRKQVPVSHATACFCANDSGRQNSGTIHKTFFRLRHPPLVIPFTMILRLIPCNVSARLSLSLPLTNSPRSGCRPRRNQ